MLEIRNIRNVRKLPDGNYTCTVDLFNKDGTLFEEGAEYGANATDPYSTVFPRIEEGDYSGEITIIPAKTEQEIQEELTAASEFLIERKSREADIKYLASERQVRRGKTPAVPLQAIDNYYNALEAVKNQPGWPDPNQINWPRVPWES